MLGGWHWRHWLDGGLRLGGLVLRGGLVVCALRCWRWWRRRLARRGGVVVAVRWMAKRSPWQCAGIAVNVLALTVKLRAVAGPPIAAYEVDALVMLCARWLGGLGGDLRGSAAELDGDAKALLQ